MWPSFNLISSCFKALLDHRTTNWGSDIDFGETSFSLAAQSGLTFATLPERLPKRPKGADHNDVAAGWAG